MARKRPFGSEKTQPTASLWFLTVTEMFLVREVFVRETPIASMTLVRTNGRMKASAAKFKIVYAAMTPLKGVAKAKFLKHSLPAYDPRSERREPGLPVGLRVGLSFVPMLSVLNDIFF